MERIVWAVRNVTSGTGVSNRAERPSLRRPQIWTAFHVNGRRWRWESVRCDSSKSSPDCPLSCRGSRKLQKFVSPDFWQKNGRCFVMPQNLCSRYPWIFEEAWDDCCPPAALLSIFGLCGHFLVPEAEILTKWSQNSDGRWDRRKFDRDLRAVPQNTFQETFQKWKKLWERSAKSGGEYFEGDKFTSLIKL